MNRKVPRPQEQAVTPGPHREGRGGPGANQEVLRCLRQRLVLADQSQSAASDPVIPGAGALDCAVAADAYP